MILTSAPPMAKQRNDVSVKIDAEVYRLVRTVAAWRGVAVAEYLSDIVRPAVQKDIAKMSKEAAERGKDKGG
jgi:hypothetical protein